MFLLPALVLLQEPTPAPPAAPPDPVPPARIELTTPFPVHLGSVGPREVREVLFGLRSTHDRTFHFRVLDLSLGLTLDEGQLAAPIQPGEVRLVKAQVNPTGMEGFVRGAVRLGTDDPTQPNYILRYDMTVRPEVVVDAERKSLGEVAPHESPELRFRFTREGGDPLKLVLASELPPHLEAELIHEGPAADLRISLRPIRLKPGTTAGLEVLKVATNGPKQPLFTLYLDWRLAAPVIAQPSRLVFSELKTTLLGLELTARNGLPFRIRRAEIQGRGFELLDRPTLEAARHLLRVRRTGATPEAMLVLECSNQEEPLRVPLRFLDPKARPPKGSRPAPPVEDHGHHHH
ncbi:MAG: hypothetical protein KA743_11375 [Geothrix sp.]|uniref:Uncharacterized protein n=1 Tax=Candidatus Geothrix odensensis TaxID=2954440 RepID=A0A936K762_9BACT|nr:hypothetical protein [Candidatus Geothrix odensensis]MBP7619110.1 hypothetical protein [Geothrix sp.]MCC6514552.1 hypothetical protein [Geothrix sp.]